MSQLIGPPTPRSPTRRPGTTRPPADHPLPAALSGLLGGVLAAGLGLGVIAVVVLFLWVTSPSSGGDPGAALRVAANLWLLAHGADLLRTVTVSGDPAPVGLTPLLLSALPLWLLYRFGGLAVEGHLPAPAARGAVDDPDAREPRQPPAEPQPEPQSESESEPEPGAEPGAEPEPEPQPPLPGRSGPAGAVAWLVAGYCLVGLAAVLYTSTGPLRSRPLSALVVMPLVAGFWAGAGAWSVLGCPPVSPSAVRPLLVRLAGTRRSVVGSGVPTLTSVARRAVLQLPTGRLPRTPRKDGDRGGAAGRVGACAGGAPPGDGLVPGARLTVALRAAAAGTLTLVAGGALLTAGSLAGHASAASAAFSDLSGSFSDRLGVLALALVLLPNAAVWAACYALTPGFAVGTDTVVAPAGARYPELPRFPLFAALPGQGDGGTAGWLTLVVPITAAVVVVAVVARGMRALPPARCGVPGAAAVAGLSSVGVGVATALLAAWASGPLGEHRLAELGPLWWATGTAACCWTLALSVPLVPVVRWWQLRGAPAPAAAEPTASPPVRGAPPPTGPLPTPPAAAGPAAAAGPPGGEEVGVATGAVERRAHPLLVRFTKALPGPWGSPHGRAPVPPRRGSASPERPDRAARWERLRVASGGLVPPFPAAHPEDAPREDAPRTERDDTGGAAGSDRDPPSGQPFSPATRSTQDGILSSQEARAAEVSESETHS